MIMNRWNLINQYFINLRLAKNHLLRCISILRLYLILQNKNHSDYIADFILFVLCYVSVQLSNWEHLQMMGNSVCLIKYR